MVKIIAGTTAYCDRMALKNLIEQINTCALKISQFVIIDNSPQALMSDFEIESTCLVPFIYKHFPANPGLGTALNSILNIATELDAEFVWLFDQDSHPTLQCLEHLILSASAANVAICAPTCIGVVSGQPLDTFLWQHGRLVSLPCLSVPAAATSASVRDIDAAITAGLLVRVSVVQSIRPNTKLFLDLIDFEWCLRVRDAGLRIVQVSDAKLLHGLGNPRLLNIFGIEVFVPNYSALRWFYYSRNLFWLEFSRAKGTVHKCKSAWRAFARLRTVLKDDVLCRTFPSKIGSAVKGLLRWQDCN